LSGSRRAEEVERGVAVDRCRTFVVHGLCDDEVIELGEHAWEVVTIATNVAPPRRTHDARMAQ
jgi:hypothetical protein